MKKEIGKRRLLEDTDDNGNKSELYEWLENIAALLIAVAMALFMSKYR